VGGGGGEETYRECHKNINMVCRTDIKLKIIHVTDLQSEKEQSYNIPFYLLGYLLGVSKIFTHLTAALGGRTACTANVVRTISNRRSHITT